MMIGPLILLAVSAAASSQPASAGREDAGGFTPTSAVTARAKASVRIVSGVSFGRGHAARVAGAERRHVELSDPTGTVESAELLEFQ